MDNYSTILEKLNAFIAKFYTKMLLKGVILFVTLGLLFFLVILGIEYFLWLNSLGRLVLLILFVGVELFFLWKYIITPLFFLFRWRRGLTNKEASLLIGKHFAGVDDKLFNLLELAECSHKSELLLASIQQRSTDLSMVPFVNAIDFKDSIRYTKFLLIPFFIVGLIWLAGDVVSYFSSYQRVVNYDLAYEPPAPFTFKVFSTTLDVLEGESLTVSVTTEGRIKPESISIVVNGKELLLQTKDGFFQYMFNPPIESSAFYFVANGFRSKEYYLNVLSAPSILDFNMVLDYPDYTFKQDEVILSTGNAVFPEGTRVSWKIRTKSTDNVVFQVEDSITDFSSSGDVFTFDKRVFSDLDYELSISNGNAKNYERLGYRFEVVKDAYPTLQVDQVLDSLNPNLSYFVGEATDDYQLSTVRLIYYQKEQDNKKVLVLSNPNANYDKFYYTFPSGLDLEEGKEYVYYFEVMDNDAIHNGKVTKSQIFSTSILNDKQLKKRELVYQRSILENLDRSLEMSKEQQERLKEISRKERENSILSFSDQIKVKDFLRQQEVQEDLMKKFSGQLKDNLKKLVEDSTLKKLLGERLERQELDARKNEKLLEELNELAQKLDKDELAKRLDELGKKQKNADRNLVQLLELTKRYYVQQKAKQLGEDLDILSKEQEVLAEKELESNLELKEQDSLRSQFEEISKEVEELLKDISSLRKPLDLKLDIGKVEDVKKDQKDVMEELDRHTGSDRSSSDRVRSKQKSAAKKMKELSVDLLSAASGGGGGSTAEDAEMLRQLLDNLITFSFKQEALYKSLGQTELSGTVNSAGIIKQQELRDLFKHVDDSLFALSLRQAELSEFVNEQITEVYYNVDKALESMAESEIYQGASYQKYVLNASNSLSDFLANVLENLQQSMSPSKGQGEGESFQLPDIILGQEKLGEKLGELGKKGSEGNSSGEGENGKGQGERSGENSGQGSAGKGKEGKNGENGLGGNTKGAKEGKGSNTVKDGGNGSEGGSGGNQLGPSEEELNEIYQIYKEQQWLRERLEDQLNNLINNDDRKLGEKLAQQMEDFQNDLLRNGVTQQTINKMNNINREMLKLDNAALKQGKTKERESNSVMDSFKNPILTRPSILDNYRNDVEILNRQALPLHQNFQIKVKDYFKMDD
ncbi:MULTISPECIES: hypothetical protein [unclassified Arenibacter]|uniref:hypothetical protein n=1 Tax=unclassified Arenibacter TaxID=2615047 RepID=UPI000E3423B9|nr:MULTISPECIES: hypothetical protein [unclassified Arenibacter]MCM4165920.1 hypothetical protein [Arenibacter sp. A80]RFT54450.1 hypothetical protein D0S24_20145 [Arenibacter sp. P308M17]